MKRKSGSFFKILKEPSVIVIGLVLVANSSVWGFLDPTLEPHLRQVRNFNCPNTSEGIVFNNKLYRCYCCCSLSVRSDIRENRIHIFTVLRFVRPLKSSLGRSIGQNR